MSFIIIRNNSGEMTDPCGVPLCWVNLVDSSAPTLTWNVLSDKKLSIHFAVLPITPSFCNLRCSVGICSISNALSKSMKMARRCSLFFSFFSMLSWSFIIWSRVFLCFLNPVWFLVYRLLFSRYHCNLLVTIFSMILHSVGVREIGLYESGFVASLFGFKNGKIMAWCHSFGNCFSVHISL